MQVRVAACLAAIVWVAAGGARAADRPAGQQFNIMGPSNCSTWPKTGQITSATKAVSLNWALGFLSGWAAQANLALLDLVEPAEVDLWLTSYCKEHPADTLPVAVRQLERVLEARLPPPPPPPVPEPPMFVPPAAQPPKAEPAPATKAAPARRAPARRRTTPPRPKPAPATPAPPARPG